MRSVLIAMAVMATIAGTASAGSPPFAGPARTVALNPRSGAVVPTVTTLQPVIGSVQRTGHFTNPVTHKSKYTGTVYNPVLGQFATKTFRR